MTFAADYTHIAQLIEAGQASQARQALVQILYRNSMDAQAWWMYAQVAENEKQCYHILSALLDLPANPFTAKARQALAKLAYNPQAAQPKPAYEAKPQQPTKAAPPRPSFSLSTLLVGLGLVAAVIVGVVALGVISARNSVTASASASAPIQFTAPSEEGPQIVEVVTRQPEPTLTPRPSVTPFPTRTPRPLLTPTAPAPTATPVYPKAADVLPTLNQALAEDSTNLFKAADTLTKAFGASEQRSISTVQTANEQADVIRRLRNKVAWTNLSQVAPDARDEAVLPAHTAFNDYANSLLQWIDLEVQAYRASATMGQTDPSALSAARKQLDDQNAQASKQADLVKVKRNTLEDKLLDYKVFTEQSVLAGQLSSKAVFLTSVSKPVLHLAAAKYQVSYRSEGAGGVTISLSAVGSAAAGIKLTDGQVVDLREGDYQVDAKSTDWWVVAFDPAN